MRAASFLAGVVKDMVFINSGYPRKGGLPRNVLLAFEAQWNFPSGTFPVELSMMRAKDQKNDCHAGGQEKKCPSHGEVLYPSSR
jgi:hypothetical protein